MRSGAGIKNKVLQAWSMGKAVVATPQGVGGLAAVDGDQLRIRDGVDAFAQAVLELLDDPAERARLGERGRRTVLDRFRWSAIARQGEALLEAAAAGSR